jgi:conjugal transfer mating pair stabilization protein TraG
LLFILTPLNLRVASYTLGLFVFVALWGVIDAGIYQLTLGRAMDALAEMRSNHVAANAWLLAPSSAMKALAIFGSFRTSAAGLAGAFTFTIFRFSGNVFTAVTSEALQAQGQGSSAAAPLMTREGYASALESQASASGTMARRGAASSFVSVRALPATAPSAWRGRCWASTPTASRGRVPLRWAASMRHASWAALRQLWLDGISMIQRQSRP